MAEHHKVLVAISVTTDPAKLRKFCENAQRLGVAEVKEAAFRGWSKLYPKRHPEASSMTSGRRSMPSNKSCEMNAARQLAPAA